MLNAIKRWISGGPTGPDWTGVSAWAQKQGHGFKRAKDDQGFVVDGSFGTRPWRLEWGPPQRAYIMMSRALMEMLERETFERYTQSNQTLIDVSTPEEMRWLAMFPKVNLDLPKSVRGSFGAVASDPTNAVNWVDAAFAQQLAHASLNLLRDQPPFVIMTLRGRVYMRLQLETPDPVLIAQATELFDAAAQAALRLTGVHETRSGDWPTTASTAWHTDLAPLPDEPKGRGSK
jgi:hypothetical protein